LEAIRKISILGILKVKIVPQKIVIEGENPSKFILLGEDDPDDQDLLKDVFSAIDNSFILFFVDNGKEVMSALHKLREDQKPCLIVLDYNMPGLNGAEILNEINTDPRFSDIPKVIWSTSGSEKFKRICLDLGALDYVIKPNNSKELEKIARYMLSFCTV
jgi:CheY-like chemotaxis protein